MKSLKEFKPLIKFIGDDKKRLIIASTIIFINGICSILTGYLNGIAVEAITELQVKKAITYLLIYFAIEVVIEGILSQKANSILFSTIILQASSIISSLSEKGT